MTAEHDRIPEQTLAWLDAGKGAALATVTQTWGSAPRPAGAQLAVSSEAEIMGSVSGGCVESAVAAEALEALEDGACRVMEFGVSDEEAFAVGLACGGEINVMVEPVDLGQGPERGLIERLTKAREGREGLIYAVNTRDWTRRLIGPGENGPLAEAAAAARRADKAGFEGDWFLGVHNPPLRLAVIGAVHIAQPLMKMAHLAGYDAMLIDPRDAFATEARFPGESFTHDWPDEALDAFGLDERTAVITLTHDPKIDDPAIAKALGAPVFYLGCLGSKKTHGRRVERLREAGFTDQDMARIHAPIGLAIGSRSPAEIAVAVLAEMTQALRRPEA